MTNGRTMTRTHTIGLGALVTALALAGSATSASDRESGTLRVNAKLAARWKFNDAHCPPRSPVNIACARFVGTGPIPGLGLAKSNYVKTLVNSNGCSVKHFNRAVIAVVGKGTLTLSRRGKACGPTAPARTGPLKYTVSAGTGAYARAAGTLVFRSSVHMPDFTCGPCGTGEDTWRGTLTVPGLEFDITAPVIEGATPMTVTAPQSAMGMNVDYAVTATDAIDGQVAATCTPKPGTFFGRGKTTVTCSALDSSGNTGRAEFTVTVE
jgi:HYR domain